MVRSILIQIIMAYINETILHEELSVSIDVLQKKEDETYEDYEIISLHLNQMSIRTPQDLVKLGSWLCNQGAKIWDEYNKDGKKKYNE